MHMMQDERNAHIFYNHLSRVAPREEYSAVLAEISMQCRQRVDTYAILLNKLCSSEFSPQETAVNTLVAFDEGITLAIAEENKSLRALTEWLDTLEDAAVARTVQNIINRKMLSHHQLMHLG